MENDLFKHAEKKSKIVDPGPPAIIEEAMVNNPNGDNLRIKTEQWIQKNPDLYALYKKFAHALLAKGRNFSVKLITERIRWECYVEYNTDFKISNDYPAYIARKLAEDIPELKTVLKFKKTRW